MHVLHNCMLLNLTACVLAKLDFNYSGSVVLPDAFPAVLFFFKIFMYLLTMVMNEVQLNIIM